MRPPEGPAYKVMLLSSCVCIDIIKERMKHQRHGTVMIDNANAQPVRKSRTVDPSVIIGILFKDWSGGCCKPVLRTGKINLSATKKLGTMIYRFVFEVVLPVSVRAVE